MTDDEIGMTDDEIYRKIRDAFSYCMPLFGLALVIPIIFLVIDIFGKEANPLYLFQRSGALAVLLAAWGEYILYQIDIIIKPSPAGYVTERKWGSKYGVKYKYCSYTAIGLVIVGTLVWGYGDIPFKIS